MAGYGNPQTPPKQDAKTHPIVKKGQPKPGKKQDGC